MTLDKVGHDQGINDVFNHTMQGDAAGLGVPFVPFLALQ